MPRASLPLNVFEPRYLTLVDNVMNGSRILGIVQPSSLETGASSLHETQNPQPDFDSAKSHLENESPEGKSTSLHDVGCAGRITAYQELEDGRYLITLSGIARFKIITEMDTADPFRTFMVSYDQFEGDMEDGRGEQDVDREHLLKVLRSYLEANNMDADWQAIQRASSEVLINALSVMSPYGPEEKQALLEAKDLKARAAVLTALAEMELASGGETGGTLQ